MLLTNPARSYVPPPPANQSIGLTDGVFNNLDEAECLFVTYLMYPDNHAGCTLTILLHRHHLLLWPGDSYPIQLISQSPGYPRRWIASLTHTDALSCASAEVTPRRMRRCYLLYRGKRLSRVPCPDSRRGIRSPSDRCRPREINAW